MGWFAGRDRRVFSIGPLRGAQELRSRVVLALVVKVSRSTLTAGMQSTEVYRDLRGQVALENRCSSS